VAKILVVDDEPAIRALLLELLEAEGYAAVGAPNGRVAVELAARERPDLVLSDVMMPELDGPGMVRSLRAAPELANVPIVLMSAANGAVPVEPTVTAFIPKPFDLDDVLAIVARSLRGNAE
jgi:CheY-like chemotaxis protein